MQTKNEKPIYCGNAKQEGKRFTFTINVTKNFKDFVDPENKPISFKVIQKKELGKFGENHFVALSQM